MAILKRGGKAAATSVVGLDIDPGHLAAAEVHVNGSISVTRGAVAKLRPGVLRDGELADGPALTEALKALWAEHKLPVRVRVGIANQRIVVRTLDLPPLTDEKAIASAVKVEAPDHIPMPIDEAVLDHRSLGVVETAGGPRTRVVVVAVRREMVERYADAIRAAGLKIEGVDLSAFALVRAMASSGDDAGVLYVHAAGLTNVAVASGGSCLFTRAAAGGLDSIVQTLAERRGLTLEHAEQWIGHVGLETPLVAATRVVLEEGVHQLADTVRNSLNFYRMQQNSETVSRAVLTGPAAVISGFAASFAAALGMPVDAAVVGHAADTADPGRLAIAAGLAVESVE
jgi:type IV pilus assembly protein PilM